MLFPTKRPTRLRYVEFRDGQFVSVHQTKASSHLAAQEDNQHTFSLNLHETEEGSQLLNLKETSPTIFEEKIPLKWQRRFQLFFFLLLLGMSILIVSLTQNFWKNTQAYLTTEEISIVQTTDPEPTPIAPSETQVTDLTHILHTHHATNELYESAKPIVRQYASGQLTAGERTIALTKLLTEINQLLEYNKTRLEERVLSDSEHLYQLNDQRLTQLKDLITTLIDAPYRGLSIERLNVGIQDDQILFNQQIEGFKALLDKQQIPYNEKEGRLYFSFPG